MPGAMELTTLTAQPDGTRGAGLAPRRALAALRQRRGARLQLAGAGWTRRRAAARPAGSTATSPTCRCRRNRAKWRALECAKRRLLYALLRFGVPIASQKDGEARGLAFDFLEGSRGAPVMTGHANGLDHHQHLRGRLGRARAAAGGARRAATARCSATCATRPAHYYWDLLVARRRPDRGEPRRSSATSARATPRRSKRYYERRPEAADWEDGYVSAYATMHPWEDFAETWTHYLHMVDTLDTGGELRPRRSTRGSARIRAHARGDRLRPLPAARPRRA